MNFIRDNNIEQQSIKWEFYKIFINLDKNKLPQLIKFIEGHNKSERNQYFQEEFKSSFISFQYVLCWQK